MSELIQSKEDVVYEEALRLLIGLRKELSEEEIQLTDFINTINLQGYTHREEVI